jgi:hypothetical protein
MHGIGSLVEQSFEELIEISQYQVALFIGGIQEASFVRTSQDSELSGGYFTSFRLVGTELTPSTSYHPQMDGQTKIVNKWLEGYLRNYVSGQQKSWIKWLHLGEHCYNTTYHMLIGMTPFRALYGYDAPTFVDRVFGDNREPKAKDWVQESQDILRTLKENLEMAQNQQKVYADRHRVEHSFEVGTWCTYVSNPIGSHHLR